MGARGVAGALALLGPLWLCACTYSVSRAGDARFLGADLSWRPGVTTLGEVASSLGPPDLIRRSSDDLVFVYRFRQEVKSSFLISFYLNLLSRDRLERTDTTLVVTFDRDDLLVSRGVTEFAPVEPAPLELSEPGRAPPPAPGSSAPRR